MRLRHIIGLAVIVVAIGAGIWFFVSGTNDKAVGAGGLPLIKADTNPVKLPPEEPGGDIMPNADSTVFPAIAGNPGEDPSMEDLKLPSAQKPTTESVDFAGLKTGFAIPVPAEKKTESLFEHTETEKSPNDYVSGLAPTALNQNAPAPQTTTEEPVVETKKESVQEPAADITPSPADLPPPAPIANTADNVAQNMEEQEKAIMITPPVKPPVPGSRPDIPATPDPDLKPNEAMISARPENAPATKKTAEDTVKADVANEAYKAPKAEPKAEPVKSGYYMQLASTTAKGEAPILWSKLLKKYPDALAGLKASYQTATVPGKGDYIRVQAGPLTQTEAASRCKQLRAVDPKGGCLVIKR